MSQKSQNFNIPNVGWQTSEKASLEK